MREWILVSLCAVAFAKHANLWMKVILCGSSFSRTAVDLGISREQIRPNDEISHRVHNEDIKSQLDIEDEIIEARHAEFRARSTPEKPYDNYLRLGAVRYNLTSVFRI
ncbi:unnamed protein product [Pieris macdunnoughi]|uniref:Uncharacterized protein n=1 Tax=Pieris macdunnoughi TaxID=345717 RepID=A0A821M881_9NEOP|nr:unnamed protein product [Pieris macdunnoughi]